MAVGSKIEWTDATWNPTVGCSIVSPGCKNCYAMKMADRLASMGPKPDGTGSVHLLPYQSVVTRDPTGRGYEWSPPVWNGTVAWAGNDRLLQPLRRRKPTRYFVNSMSDLFHENVPDEWIDRVFAVMALSPQHTFQILTKRSKRMREYCEQIDNEPVRDTVRRIVVAWPEKAPVPVAGITFPLPNVWLGVSAEDQARADERVPDLLATPAAVRFVSAEPLLGPINLARYMHEVHLDWVIVGGESGADARPMSIQWVREIRDQCAGIGVPFLFKQWGEWGPAGGRHSGTPGRFAFGDYEHDRALFHRVDGYPRQFDKFGARSILERVGKARAGRLLDGRAHDDFPFIATTTGA